MRQNGHPYLQRAPFNDYELNGAYDEMFASDGTPRPHYGALH